MINKMFFDFGQRKVQKVGYSYLLPIPTNWVRNMKIEKGDTLLIKMTEDKSLRITSGQAENGCLVNPEKTWR
jgi:antitoxin component of MazEF toxin-antitoxin module